MIKIRASELAPENIGYPVKFMINNGIEYHMLTGFKINKDHVVIWSGDEGNIFDLDYYITVYDKDI